MADGDVPDVSRWQSLLQITSASAGRRRNPPTTGTKPRTLAEKFAVERRKFYIQVLLLKTYNRNSRKSLACLLSTIYCIQFHYSRSTLAHTQAWFLRHLSNTKSAGTYFPFILALYYISKNLSCICSRLYSQVHHSLSPGAVSSLHCQCHKVG